MLGCLGVLSQDKLGVKLNDVLLACATAALRQALIDAHKDTKPTPHHKNSDSGEASADSDGESQRDRPDTLQPTPILT